jgi:glycosyltransferase involved in cell wall biosynthesis
MACELPIVASRVGGITDFLKDGETGLYCEPGQPDTIAAVVSRLLQAPDLRRSMGVRGRQMVEQQYQWDEVAERIGALYEELLAS